MLQGCLHNESEMLRDHILEWRNKMLVCEVAMAQSKATALKGIWY